MRQSGFDRKQQCLFIHECKHQYFLGVGVHGDAWNDPVRIELGCKLITFLDLLNAGAEWVDKAAFRDGNQVWGQVVADIPEFNRELVEALKDAI